MVTTRRNSDDDVPNFEAMIAAAMANALPNLSDALRTHITNDIRNGAGASGGGGDNAIPQGIHVWIERFTKLKPLAFRSAATPAEAEDWITHMEKLFQVLGCPDNFKTRLGAFKLEGDALSWWKAHLHTQVGGDAFADTCTWVAFREIFYNRYFPASEQQRYEREYGSIYQLDRENSGEYMERFTRLASFVGTAAGDTQRQAKHFKWGLKKWVLDRIVNTEYTNVTQVAAAARNIELLHESGNSNKRDRDGNRFQNRGQGQQENKGRHDQGQHEYRGRQDQSVEHRDRQDRGYDSRRQDFRGQYQRFTGRNGNDRQGQGNYNQRQHRGQSTRDFNQGHASGSANQRRSTETLPPPPLCTTCGKPHPGVCYKATGGCFTCGSTQHKVKDCPQAKQKQNMPTDFARLPPTTGRVYATTRDQAAKTSGTITGNLYIDDRTVFVLFDTGATHSIISTTFAKKLNMNPTPLIERIIISTPMKNHMLIDHEYVNCPLRFDDRIRPANLLPIHMLDFDVILGMDWLASHRATIDCYARTVIFGNVRQPEFVYHGSSPLKSVKLISAMKARTLISHGCQGFLASVMDTSLESPNIENLSVVREFADVFPDELPGLPPAREIEFGIELIPGAEPISKAPYRMAPVELKELKEQLQEMLENGFIRPSVSPWGAPAVPYCSKLNIRESRSIVKPLEIPIVKWDDITMDFVTGVSELADPVYFESFSIQRLNVGIRVNSSSIHWPDVDVARQEDSAVELRNPPTTTRKKEFKDIEDSSRPERSILTLKPLPTINPKDKGKSVLEEPEPAKKMTRSDFDAAQIARDAEIARQLQVDLQAEVERERQREEEASKAAIAEMYDEVQAGIDADALFAAKLQQEEREEYTIEERAKFLAETIAAQRKFRAAQRSAEIRSRPPTKSQLRNLMMTYLKNMGGYKHSQLKAKSFEEIKGMYERQKKSVQDFVPIGSAKEEELIKKMNEKATGEDTSNKEKVLEEPDSTKVEVKQEGHKDGTKKRPGRRLKMKATKKSKRQKTDSDLEEGEQLKAFLVIVPDEEGIIDYEFLEKRFPIINWESKFYEFDRHGAECIYYRIFRSDGSSRWIKTFSEMVTRTMFDANAEVELWHNQEIWNLKSWDLYENSGVHTLILEDGTEIHMLAKRKYPLLKETLKRMLSFRLVAGTACEDAYTLLRFIQKQIDKHRSHDGGEKDL
ncbi:putative reverse transcriptase domain-containing protein [Tanacetum coccineum]